MKRITLILICLLQVQYVFTQYFEFSTQEEIDSFQVNYPGLYQCHGVIIGGDEITNLEGLSSLTTITENIYIEQCDNLESLSGLENLSYVGITEGIAYGLSISDNNRLKNLNGLNGLTTIIGRLGITLNDSLESVSGLENLTIGGDGLYIEDNSTLESLLGLSGLTTIGEDGIKIQSNPQLTNLFGLENIEGSSVDFLWIKHNDALAHCHVQSICDYLVSPNGSTDIANNSVGCNSILEVVEACFTGINDFKNNDEPFKVYPNPTNELMNLSFQNSNSICQYDIELINIYGLVVRKINRIRSTDYSINTAELEAGVYFYMIKEKGKVVQQGKLIKK